jgi:hydrogenase maturation protease
MSVKVIAIGNSIMGNDMIGLRVLENIDCRLKANHIETYIGETDFEYCLSAISNNDFIFVIDAAILGGRLGELTIIPLEAYPSQIEGYTQHLFSLLDLIHFYHKDVRGYVIGIEVENIVYSLNLSIDVEMLLNSISSNVFHNIIKRIPQKSCRTY